MSLVNLHIEHEHIAVITLNRPEAANALSKEMLIELNGRLDQIKQDDRIYCAIITGSSEKVFCAGADLKERKGMSNEQVIQAVKSIGETVNNVESLPIPVIAAINGGAFGGGLELALACDIRIACEDAKLGLTETALAIIPGAGGTQRLPRLIGVGHAKRLIYSAKPVLANEAYHLGLVQELVDSSKKAIDAAIEMANGIVNNGPIALRMAKAAIDQGIQVPLSSGLAIEHMCYKETIPTADRSEGLLAFQQKRKPRYQGK